MTYSVLLHDGSTRTVNADDTAVDDEGNLTLMASGKGVAIFASGCWAGVWVTGQVTSP